MTTRTFANKEELMTALLRGEKWSLSPENGHLAYQPISGNFIVVYSDNSFRSCSVNGCWCDSKTLWHKVQEKTELDGIKEKYASGDYICILYVSDKWEINNYPAFIEIGSYKLIHKKHKDILDAYSADNSVNIQINCRAFNTEWEWIDTDFITKYDEAFEYRLKPKKKTIELAMFTCYNSEQKEWVRPEIFESIEKFKNKFCGDICVNHHEISYTRYEQEIDE